MSPHKKTLQSKIGRPFEIPHRALSITDPQTTTTTLPIGIMPRFYFAFYDRINSLISQVCHSCVESFIILLFTFASIAEEKSDGKNVKPK